MKVGRPTKYEPEFCQKVDEYLIANQDEEVEFVKQRNDEKGYEMYETKLKVRLPTIEGFARFLDVSKKTLYNWADKYEEFLHTLGKIEAEQQERLINSGLSGDYNSTIAKLILSSNHGMAEKSDVDVKSGGKTISGINYLKPNGNNQHRTNSQTGPSVGGTQD